MKPEQNSKPSPKKPPAKKPKASPAQKTARNLGGERRAPIDTQRTVIDPSTARDAARHATAGQDPKRQPDQTHRDKTPARDTARTVIDPSIARSVSLQHAEKATATKEKPAPKRDAKASLAEKNQPSTKAKATAQTMLGASGKTKTAPSPAGGPATASQPFTAKRGPISARYRQTGPAATGKTIAQNATGATAETAAKTGAAASAETLAKENPAASAETAAKTGAAASAETLAKENPAATGKTIAQNATGATAETAAKTGAAATAETLAKENPAATAETLAKENPAASAETAAKTGAAATGERTPEQQQAPSSQPAIGPGAQIQQYEIIRELGRGGMGQVFLARDKKLARKVAIKFLHTTSGQFTQRFLIEARATARCNHENIVIIYEVNEHEGMPFMALEYLEGQPLTALIGDRKLPTARVVEIMVPVVRALVRAHEFGIVHRDLKPDNIFVCDSGVVKVLDFGIAKLYAEASDGDGPNPLSAEAAASAHIAESRKRGGQKNEVARRDGAARGLAKAGFNTKRRSEGMTQEGAIMGTMLYMSPEQWGGADVDHRTDIWATGMIMYEMLAGKNPLADLTPTQIMTNAALLDEPMEGIGTAVPDISPELERIVDRCLAKHAEHRFASAQALLEALDEMLPGRYGRRLRKDESPYPGLTAFKEQDAARFFGRTREILKMAAQIRETPLMAVVGPSGVGKSSFVRAGLVPALKGGGESWEVLITRPGRNPMAALASTLQPLTRSSSGSGDMAEQMAEQKDILEKLRKEPGYLGSVLRARANAKASQLLLFVDQFEELYTLVADPAERAAFTACLCGASDDASAPLRVVVSMRSDFLDRAAEDQKFIDELTRGLFFLRPPDRQGLREAITMPAEMAGYTFEESEMVDDMLQALQHTSGALPLLQFAASRLWDHRDKRNEQLTRASYDEMGGIGGALATHADEVLAGLSAPAQKLTRAVFQRLVTADGTRAIVDVADIEDLASDPKEIRRIVDHLTAARLLVVQTRSEEEGPAIELVHESLISSWPTLRRWLDESQEDAAFLEQLRTVAKQWDKSGRPQGLLWRGEAMEEAQRFDRRYKGNLSKREREYLDAVLNLATRSARIRKIATMGTIAFLIALVIGAAIALVLIRNAEKDAKKQASLAKTEAKRALAAEQKAKREFERYKEAQQGRVQAEKAATKAKTEVATKKKELKSTQSKYNMTRQQLEEALTRAEAEKKRAKKASAAARTAAEKAQLAEAKARKLAEKEQKAAKKLKKLLTREKARVRKLIKERNKIATSLK